MRLLSKRCVCAALWWGLLMQITGMPALADGWQIVFEDTFDGAAVDMEKWTHEVGADIWGNDEAQYYTGGENAWVEDGCLVLEARRETNENKAYTSARLIMREAHAFRYGRVEVRAAMPMGKGTWPAIWMLPSGHRYGRVPDSGEIDIVEHVGHEEANFYSTVHTHNRSAGRLGPVSSKTAIAAPEAFHDYTLEWTPESITIRIDGEEILRYAPDDRNDWREWPFDEPFLLLLNIAVGGTWGGAKGIDDECFPQRMRVEHVRVYRPLSQENGGK